MTILEKLQRNFVSRNFIPKKFSMGGIFGFRRFVSREDVLILIQGSFLLSQLGYEEIGTFWMRRTYFCHKVSFFFYL
jgi:hypothetical protein